MLKLVVVKDSMMVRKLDTSMKCLMASLKDDRLELTEESLMEQIRAVMRE